ncbi:hydroxymethylglutaryl-CoA synthase [Oceanobacillus alkalisoli]|uniref:hydroxymethylglutaryl-CoA synthase n=1 Tax=Oceanobacillus alkalisoli TaxID=2925113 RepID=UPI001EEF83AE|nr:hydroxymethylglutaryl-CoA synthase [Oceanobacillus alkalisoli]MCF3942134.1 hydroxymethylglutaryl-CoA synthase [Oceanobacillus alkalisoli]MCG5105001.1 hydroxymethylglutaryl-CoA synthase [Oceanobacillus alkalisoli]
MEIGIDKIGFYAPHYYVDMVKLAEARGIDPDKFTIGIGQDEMALAPVTQDAVTLAANAALQVLDEVDKEKIDLVLFGTESGIDHSKSAAVYIHHLLGLNPYARSIELKQACYSATAGIQMAKGHIALNPKSKVLVIGSDIARYGLATPGESTQGAGAVAMVISKDPKLLAIENESTYFTNDIMDFWRPLYSDTACVDGKFSNEQYIHFFNTVWEKYKEQTGRSLEDFAALCYHVPYTKMGWKALRTILEEGTEACGERLRAHYETSIQYNRKVGNIYTGSLYLSLLSLLEKNDSLKGGDRIGLYSYGSGAVGEFFTGILQHGYQQHLYVNQHEELFKARQEVSVEEYEEIFADTLPADGSTTSLDAANDPAAVYLSGVEDHKRIYVNRNN